MVEKGESVEWISGKWRKPLSAKRNITNLIRCFACHFHGRIRGTHVLWMTRRWQRKPCRQILPPTDKLDAGLVAENLRVGIGKSTGKEKGLLLENTRRIVYSDLNSRIDTAWLLLSPSTLTKKTLLSPKQMKWMTSKCHKWIPRCPARQIHRHWKLKVWSTSCRERTKGWPKGRWFFAHTDTPLHSNTKDHHCSPSQALKLKSLPGYPGSSNLQHYFE